MVGKMNDANCITERRYNNANNTGLGNVFVTKLSSVCKCGRMFDKSGALERSITSALVIL